MTPIARRATLAKAAAQVALLQVGFTDATIHIDRSGRIVTIVIPASSACAAQPGDERKLRDAVRRAASFVAQVSVVVSGARQSLSSYLATRCRNSLSSSGGGKVVYERSARGVVNAPTFKIRSRRWTVDFSNSGSFLAVFVVKNGKIQGQPIVAKGHKTGSGTFAGPGRFSLRISGSGTWTVHVRDGA